MSVGDNASVWAEAAGANGLQFSSEGGETPDLVGTRGGSRVVVQCAFAEKGESENGTRLGYWYPCVSVYFAEPLLLELSLEDTAVVSIDARRARQLFGARDAGGSSPKERIAAMLAAPMPGRRAIRGDDERITCELHPTWGSLLGGNHSLSHAGISWALSELAAIVSTIDAAHAKLGVPSWIAEVRRNWRELAERRELRLDERELLLRSPNMTCEVRSGTRRTTAIEARFTVAPREPFCLAGVRLRGPWEHRLARLFGSSVPSTGDDAFDRRFDAGGNVPRALLGPDARESLVLLHREAAACVRVTAEGLSATFDGIPETDDLESLLDAAESVVDSVKS